MTSAEIDIEELIPHTGKMVLIDSVTAWDDAGITCRTISHLKPDNPLRNDTGLPAVAAVEYGGQAAAVHGGLTGGRGNGLLVAVRDLTAAIDYLDQISGDLVIKVDCMGSSTQSSIYRFRIYVADAADADIASGRITIARGGWP